ncbi:MAG: hypothetical protein JSV14_12120 [Deltaproteobacteria bacterium]|nr:MAG: hypothetical protein JSV14_12120 [Deltaproteobacteria bacterium]
MRETDLFGRFYLKKPNGGRFQGYYESLNGMRSFLRSKEWLQSVTGYYVNVAGKQDAVRLSYWTIAPQQTRKTVDLFVSQNDLKHIKEPIIPEHAKNSAGYGGEELRFRRFLGTYTLIGLEIMETDLLNARRLFATFRWQVMRAGKAYRPHFLGTFEDQSFFFNCLSASEKEQFWRDLAYWPDPNKVDWAHLFVNMVLAADWFPVWQHFHSPQRPLSFSEINQLVEPMGFQIPENWSL